MNDYTLDQLTTMINALQARVNILDGQNLQYPTVGSTTSLQQQINSLTTDFSQLAANFEAQLAVYQASLNALQAQYNVLTGAPNVPPTAG